MINERLCDLRKERDLTQAELAKELGICESAIKKYEAGDRSPRDQAKVQIAKYFGVSVGYLFFGE